MGKPAYPLRYKLIALCAAALLACGLLPLAAFADDSQAVIASQVGASSGVASAMADQVNDSTDSSSDDSQQVSGSQDAGNSRVAPMLASGLFGAPTSFVRSDVAFDAADPVVGSFTVDGLTYAVNDGGGVTLIAVSSGLQRVMGSQDADDSRVAPMLASGQVAVPASVTYNDTTYPVTAVGPYAFYLSGATDVALPASVASVDDRAFRSSDMERVEVGPANPNLASFDGALYSADLSRLLLIPEGRKGSVLLSCETEVVEASLFSHCSLVEAISVEEGGAAFSSWDGLLYDASGATLLRVPAGATDITIRDGCTTIVAGAMEGCVKLERINAPASVTSISPDVFTSIPTVSLPAQMAVQDGTKPGVASGLPDQANVSADSAPQFTAMVALASTDDDLPEVNPGLIQVFLVDDMQETTFDKLLVSPGGALLSASPIVGPSVPRSTCVYGIRDGISACLSKTLGDAAAYSFALPMNGATALTEFNGYCLEYDSTYGYYFHSSVSDFYWFEDRASGTFGHEIRLGNPDGESFSYGKMPDAITEQNIYVCCKSPTVDISFDTSSEPGDADYPGDTKDDQTINVDDGTIEIEDPKRPGYVFEGWVIPSGDGTEAVDQELVYQGDDGKWYVDASKLPDYAGDDGRVELTARWTSVISVDVPSSVTFYADLVTQGQESREGAAEGAFGQSKVRNQSEVDLRIVGLESSAVPTTDTTLGADSILKKASAATPSTSTQKLLSLYPSTKQWTADELQDPDAVGGSKATTAVDFDLDDILLEKSFAADDFTIAAGGTLNMGYRLNLSETGQQLDYDKLSTLSEGQSASIANVSYTFAGGGHVHGSAGGTLDDDIYIEYDGKIYGTDDILDAAECISENGTASPCYELYNQIMYAQGVPVDGVLPADAKAKIYAKYDGPEATASQPNCDRAGYVRLQLLGVNHDALELSVPPDSAYDYATQVTKKVGLTFQFMDVLFESQMNSTNTNQYGWKSTKLRNEVLDDDGAIFKALAIHDDVKTVYKFCNSMGGSYAQGKGWRNVVRAVPDRLFVPSYTETGGHFIREDFVEGGINDFSNHEGYMYEYWEDVCGIVRNVGVNTNTGARAKKNVAGSLSRWWLNRPYGDERSFSFIKEDGTDQHLAAINVYGVCPTFCL